MDDQQFWAQVRRGLLTVIAAIDSRYRRQDRFWNRMRDGLVIVVTAIERRYHFTRHSVQTIGQPGPSQNQHSEPPLAAPAPSSPEGVGTRGIQ